MRTLYLAPSSLSFLAHECVRCYYLEVHSLRKRPRTPFPAIFTRIDSAMKEHLAEGSHLVDPALPSMQIVAQGRRVISQPIPITDADVELVIRGNYDSLVAFDDHVLGVVDWKTTRVRPEIVDKYSLSLHAYAYAIEHPAVGISRAVGRLGLGVFEPNRFLLACGGEAHLGGSFEWIDVPRDDESFNIFIRQLGKMLGSRNAPAADSDCQFCAYAEAA
jgi:PD-(D/E)XK nuclease superfamily